MTSNTARFSFQRHLLCAAAAVIVAASGSGAANAFSCIPMGPCPPPDYCEWKPDPICKMPIPLPNQTPIPAGKL